MSELNETVTEFEVTEDVKKDVEKIKELIGFSEEDSLVRFNYKTDGHINKSKLKGVTLSTYDVGFDRVWRKKKVIDGMLNIKAVKKKLDELRETGKKAKEIRAKRKVERQKKREAKKSLEEELDIEYPHSISYYKFGSGKYKLKLGRLTAEQVKTVMETVQEFEEE